MLKRFGQWLIEPNLYWAIFVVPGICVLFAFFIFRTEAAIRITGLILQLCGTLTVIYEIQKTRKQFQYPTLKQSIQNWLSRFPLRHVSVTIYAVPAVIRAGAAPAQVTASNNPAINNSVDERIKFLEKKICLLEEKDIEIHEEFVEKISEIRKMLDNEIQSREQKVKSIESFVRSSATSGLNVSAIGAVWLFFGLILSTTSNELALYLLK